jgi:hypothetical protein
MNALLVASYVWTQVIVPGKTAVQQFGINDKGQTAVTTDDGTTGIYQLNDDDERPLGQGTFRPLPPPPSSCGCQVSAAAINNSAVIIGIAFLNAGSGPEKGFLLSGSTYTFFSWPGWDNTEPRGIGNQGLVVGHSFSNDFTRSAGFIYDPSSGVFTNVTPGSGNPSIVQGINRFVRVAGTFVQPSPRKLFGLVSQPNPINVFGATQVPFANHFQLGGAGTRARGINDFGVTTGFINTSSGTLAAFVGSDVWGYEIVVPPGGDKPGNSSICTGINNLGQIACAVSDANLTTLGLFIGSIKPKD